MDSQKKALIKRILVVILMLISVTGIIYFTSNNLFFDDSELRISQNNIKDGSEMAAVITATIRENSADTFRKINSEKISQEDIDFLKSYFNNFSKEILPPLSKSKVIVDKYKDLLKIFEENKEKDYICLAMSGDACALDTIKNIIYLESLSVITLYLQGKIESAQKTTRNIITFGKKVSTNSDTLSVLSAGWEIESLGYMLHSMVTAKKNKFSNREKNDIIFEIRKNHKNVIKYEYTRSAVMVEVFDATRKAEIKNEEIKREKSGIEEDEELEKAEKDSWNAVQTKKSFFDSYKVALNNIDLSCNSDIPKSKLQLDSISENPTKNPMGKNVYAGSYTNIDELNQKRCQMERLVNGL